MASATDQHVTAITVPQALIAGCIYLCFVFARDLWLAPTWAVGEWNPEAFRASIAAQEVIQSAVLVGIAASLCYRVRHRAASVASGTSLVIRWAIAIGAASWLLNAVGVWQYSWRSQGSSAPLIVGFLLHHGDYVVLVLAFIRTVLLVPLIEESFFRYGLLRFLATKTRSGAIGVLGTSFMFTALHTGTGGLQYLWGWFAFSIFASVYMLREDSRIGVPIAMHGSRNLVEVLSLFLATGT